MKKGLIFFILLYSSCALNKNALKSGNHSDIITAMGSVKDYLLIKSNVGNVFLIDSTSNLTDFIDIDSQFIVTEECFNTSNLKDINYQLQLNTIWNQNDMNSIGISLIKKNNTDRMFSIGGWEKILKKYKNGYFILSKPLFNSNKDCFLIFISYRCGGLCGFGEISFFKKNGNSYLKQKSLTTFYY